MTARHGYMIAPQAAIEVTLNEYGDVTLRQDDASISVTANNLETLVEILVDIIGYAPPQPDDSVCLDDDEPPTALAKQPKHSTAPMTNAERQKRHRNAKRNGTVTARNGDRNANRNGGSP